LQFFVDGQPHLFETRRVVGLDSCKALIERGADRLEFSALAALRIGELLHDRRAQRFRTLVGLHSVALKAGGQFLAQSAGIFGLGLPQTGDIVARIDCAGPHQQGNEQNDYDGENKKGNDGKHFCAAMF
jgi:hypothetical protein